MQNDLFTPARDARDKGIAASANHADQESPTWTQRALAFLHAFAVEHDEFTIEQVRLYAESKGLPLPPDKRAWGRPTRNAVTNGWIQKTDRITVSADPKVHCNRLTLWRSLLAAGN